MRISAILLGALLLLASVANAASVEVRFIEQTPGAWAVELYGDTPISSTGIFIAGANPYTGFSDWHPDSGVSPVVGLPGVNAAQHAIFDPSTPWGVFNGTWFDFPAGLLINAGPGFLGDSLGPASTWLGLGVVTATAAGIAAGEGQDGSGSLWADDLGNLIPVGDVSYTVVGATVPEPLGLAMLSLGLVGIAFIRRWKA